MLIIIGLMLSGILLGRSVKPGMDKPVRTGIYLTILVLLFLLGISVGHNRQIMDHLDTIGLEAAMITLGAVVGSAACAWLVYRFYFSK